MDNDTALGGDLEQVPSYIGVRGRQGLLVRFDLDDSWTGHHYAYELYRYHQGFFEQTNVFAADHDQPWARTLMRKLPVGRLRAGPVPRGGAESPGRPVGGRRPRRPGPPYGG